MRAFFQYGLIMDVDDEEMASQLALEIEKSTRLQLVSIAERHDIPVDVILDRLQFIGPYVAVLDEVESDG